MSKKDDKTKKKRKSLMPIFVGIGTFCIIVIAFLFGGGGNGGIKYIIQQVGIVKESEVDRNKSNIEEILGSGFFTVEQPTTEAVEVNSDTDSMVAMDDIDEDDVEVNTTVAYNTSSGANIISNGTAQQYVTYTKANVNSPYFSDPGMIPLTTTYAYATVDNSYFNDALFIGDSRTEGLRLYSGLSNATFYCKTGLNIFRLLSEPIATNLSGQKVTVAEALKERQFGKIYIMIGINNLGISTTAAHKNEYQKILTTIRSLQPNAIIFIEANINMTTAYSSKSDYMNNLNLNDKNCASAAFANGTDIFYLDVNEALTDPDRGLRADISTDGIHMKAASYSLWVNYLKTHAVVR